MESTSLAPSPINDGIVTVTGGTMDGRAGWKPEKELFRRSRLDGIPKIKGAEQFEAMS